MKHQRYYTTIGVKETYICDKCGKGEMISTGESVPSYPTTFSHKCTSCGHIQCLDKTYPSIHFELGTDITEIYTERRIK